VALLLTTFAAIAAVVELSGGSVRPRVSLVGGIVRDASAPTASAPNRSYSPPGSLAATASGVFRRRATPHTSRGTGLMAFGSTLSRYSHLSDYSYVVFGGDFAVAQTLRSRTLHYEEISVCSSWNCGVPYAQAYGNGWLLKDANGNFIHTYGDTRRYLPDVGLPAYQQAFVHNTLSLLRAYRGIDGIEIDNVQTDIAAITRHVYPSKYPSKQSFQDAEVNFLSVVGPALRKAGYYVFANAGGYVNESSFDSGHDTNAFWKRIAPYLGGLMNEYWMQDPNNLTRMMDDSGGGYMHYWSGWQKLVQTAQAGGADFIGVSEGSTSDVRTMRFGKASFLLNWNGRGGAFIYAVSPAYTSGVSPWNRNWTAKVGAPMGRKHEIGRRVWRRDFTRATIVVNPTTSSFTTTIHGTSYSIAAIDALILPK
jgi:Hypothetical glycosyl hydrolase family 15